ncbi:MAG: tetraacyldisaccharide 4'-kinase [Phycisphaerae bacterium]
MKQQAIRDIMSGKSRGAIPAVIRMAAAVASGPYACAMRARRWAYRAGLARSKRAGVPVICVGNITTGGTGKTPMVAWLVAQLKGMGRRPAVLTRGYKAIGGKSDEAELLKMLCGVPVIVNADRVAGAREAVAAGADALVMDDGFQHCRLARDLDIILIDATNPFGYGRCLPRGMLREPLGAMREAGAVVITRGDLISADELRGARSRLATLAPRASIHVAVHRPTSLRDADGMAVDMRAISSRVVFAFCGLGNPAAFFSTLERMGATLAGTLALDDHAAYTAQVVERIRREARVCGANVLVTTQKDFAKLAMTKMDLPLWQLAIEMEVVDGKEDLLARVRAALERR